MWNEALIRHSFLPNDADLILHISCSATSRVDTLFWHFKSMGSFSVKSAYHLGCSILDSLAVSSSGLGSYESWWKYLWRLKIPSKVKSHIWRACKDWLPVLANLVKCGIVVDRLCPLCCNRIETIFHALWNYPVLKVVICCFVSLKGLASSDNLHIMDFMIFCRENIVFPLTFTLL